MPLRVYDKYFGGKKGSAAKAKRAMAKHYGERGEEVFYATMNKNKAKKTGKVKGKGKNPFFGNDLPFQLGTGKRWFSDSRAQGEMHGKGR